MKTSAELRAAIDAARADILRLSELDNITPEQDAELDGLVNELPELETRHEQAVKNEATVERLRAGQTKPTPVDVPNVIVKPDPTDVSPSAPIAEVRDAAARLIDAARYLDADKQESITKNITGVTGDRDGDAIARKLVASENPHYQEAFMKGVAGRSAEWSSEERRAVAEFRNAMEVGTTTEGGFGVPVLIDPTILITDGTGLTGLLNYCRIETITTNAWKGVSAGNTAWSFDAEEAEVSDDTSTFAQPTVTAHAARGFIPYSIEIGQDYPGFAGEMGRILSDGYTDLIAEKIMVGTGSDQPFGLFATTTTTVDVTTDNTFGAPDLDATWAALPEKFRARSVWVMNVDVENDIRGFGSGTATSRFTVDQSQEGISRLNGRPVVLSDYAPEWSGTDAAKILAVLDPQHFLVAQRAGMVVEHVPHLIGANQRPTGQRGLFAHARVGSDLIVQNAARVLKNITT